MNSRKGLFFFHAPQPGLNLVFHIRGSNLGGPVLHCFAKGGPRVIPETVSRRVGVKVRQRGVQRVQRIIENGDVLPRLNHTQANAGGFNATNILVTHSGSGPQHNGPCHTPRGQFATIPLVGLVLLIGDRIPAIHLSVNERIPALGQMAGQFITHRWYI